jgi:hypothetical protein
MASVTRNNSDGEFRFLIEMPAIGLHIAVAPTGTK